MATARGAERHGPRVPDGGSGTRLWPLALASERTLFQDTILRTADTTRFAPPLVVGNQEHRFILAEQLRQLGVACRALVVEPIGATPHRRRPLLRCSSPGTNPTR
jgi:mannose-1-phosphate guanylyltransferase